MTSRAGILASHLPEAFYVNDPLMQAMFAALGGEFGAVRDDIAAILAQWYIPTATFALDIYEQDYGLPVRPEAALADRRAAIIARLRGPGMATRSMVKAIAEAFDNGRIEIIEHPAARTITIRFADTRGVPVDTAVIEAALSEVMPAHLALAFEVLYLDNDTVDGYALTWNQFDELELTWDQLAYPWAGPFPPFDPFDDPMLGL